MILISYRHETPQITALVSDLAQSLVADGLAVSFDRFVPDQEDWIGWMDDALESASYVLLICSPAYRQIFEERFTEDSGRGAAWEIRYIKTDLYDAKGRNTRFIPVLLGDSSYADIPKRMRGYRHYRYPADYRFLLERLRAPPGVLESHSTLGKRDVGLIERPDLQVMQGGSGGKAASLRERFVYSSRTTTFVGRQEELEQLTAFCSADDTFAWMSVTGPAGIGKAVYAWSWLFLWPTHGAPDLFLCRRSFPTGSPGVRIKIAFLFLTTYRLVFIR